MTTISYIRTGGIPSQELAVNFDLENMRASDAERLRNLINESKFFDIPALDVKPDGPNEFAYTITVISGNSIHTIRATDTLMPKSLRPLIEDLTELAVTN
jgi:hypothetical protein